MIRNYHTLACTLLGIVLALLVQRGLDLYACILLALAVPWELLAEIAGHFVKEFYEWRKHTATMPDTAPAVAESVVDARQG